MRQVWRQLGFLHWAVPAECLRGLVPDALEIDRFDGLAYVGLVPFTMTGVRPVWAPPVAGLSRFHEVNVRTYVHHQGRDPGVWFLSLDAANRVAVWIARAGWHLPYHHARMNLRLVEESEPWGPSVAYTSERLGGPEGAGTIGCTLSYGPIGPVAEAVPGSLEHFLVERYFLYSQHRRRLFRGQVHHRPYPLQSGRAAIFSETLLGAAGITRPDAPPLVHFASCVSVDVFSLTRV